MEPSYEAMVMGSGAQIRQPPSPRFQRWWPKASPALFQMPISRIERVSEFAIRKTTGGARARAFDREKTECSLRRKAYGSR